jgi:hypothetical protein
LICKTTTFKYEIKDLDPLNETLLLSITANTISSIHYMENVANYSALFTPMKENRRRNHVNKLKNDGEVAFMNNVGYHTFLDQVTSGHL